MSAWRFSIEFDLIIQGSASILAETWWFRCTRNYGQREIWWNWSAIFGSCYYYGRTLQVNSRHFDTFAFIPSIYLTRLPSFSFDAFLLHILYTHYLELLVASPCHTELTQICALIKSTETEPKSKRANTCPKWVLPNIPKSQWNQCDNLWTYSLYSYAAASIWVH